MRALLIILKISAIVMLLHGLRYLAFVALWIIFGGGLELFKDPHSSQVAITAILEIVCAIGLLASRQFAFYLTFVFLFYGVVIDRAQILIGPFSHSKSITMAIFLFYSLILCLTGYWIITQMLMKRKYSKGG